MKSVTISTYKMRVRNTRKVGVYSELSDLPGGQDLLDLLAEYLEQLRADPDEDKANQSLLSASQIKKDGRSISGILARGEYGINSELLDREKRTLSYKRSVRDAEMMPFYFLAVIPPQGEEALIAFELEGNAGIKIQFEDGFGAFVKQKCRDCDLETEKLVPKGLLKQYFDKGRVTKLRFVRVPVPKDIADAVKKRMPASRMAMEMELQLRAERGTTFSTAQRVQKLLQGGMDANQLMQMMGFTFDTLKVEFDMDGKRRTMDLTARDDFRAGYNVTGKVVMDGGHPSFASIDEVARGIMREIMSSEKLRATGV